MHDNVDMIKMNVDSGTRARDPQRLVVVVPGLVKTQMWREVIAPFTKLAIQVHQRFSNGRECNPSLLDRVQLVVRWFP